MSWWPSARTCWGWTTFNNFSLDILQPFYFDLISLRPGPTLFWIFWTPFKRIKSGTRRNVPAQCKKSKVGLSSKTSLSGPWRQKRGRGSTVRQLRPSFPLVIRQQRKGLSSHHTHWNKLFVWHEKEPEKSNLGLTRCAPEVPMEETTFLRERFFNCWAKG